MTSPSNETFVRILFAFNSCEVLVIESTFYYLATCNCMSATICVNFTVQFAFLLVTRLNITIITSCNLLTLKLLPSFVYHESLKIDWRNMFFFFFLSDCNIWHCFLYFVVILFSAALFVLIECFGCAYFLSIWYFLFTRTVIKLGHNITDRNFWSRSKYYKKSFWIIKQSYWVFYLLSSILSQSLSDIKPDN